MCCVFHGKCFSGYHDLCKTLIPTECQPIFIEIYWRIHPFIINFMPKAYIDKVYNNTPERNKNVPTSTGKIYRSKAKKNHSTLPTCQIFYALELWANLPSYAYIYAYIYIVYTELSRRRMKRKIIYFLTTFFIIYLQSKSYI